MDPSRRPRSDGRADARADGDHAENGAQVAAGEEIGRLGRDGRPPRAPREAEEAGVEPEEPALVWARDEEGEDDADDGNRVGEDGRELASDVVRHGPGEYGARDGQEAAQAEHSGRVELVEPHVHGEGKLMERDEEAS